MGYTFHIWQDGFTTWDEAHAYGTKRNEQFTPWEIVQLPGRGFCVVKKEAR